MTPVSRHLLCEYHGCDPALLNDTDAVGALLHEAARSAGASVLASELRAFSPQGVTGFLLLAESHLSIHTWPEHGYAAVDFFSCGEVQLTQAHAVLEQGLGAKRAERMVIRRGESLLVSSHVKAGLPQNIEAKTQR